MVLYQFTIPGQASISKTWRLKLKREISWTKKKGSRLRICLWVVDCRRRSREESPEWICESRCRQVVFVYMYLRDFLALKPFHDSSLCSVCILPQPAFYSHSAVCILPLVRSLRFTLTAMKCPRLVPGALFERFTDI